MSTKRRRMPNGMTIFNNSHPLTHMGFIGARHLHPERMPSSRRDRAVSLRLLDVSQETVENVQKIGENIKRLLVPGLRLKVIPPTLLERLIRLEKLDLGYNQLTDAGIPDALKELENLIELNLNDNKLTKVPTSLKKLRNLCRLNVSHNNLETLKGLEKLKKMQILVIDNNKISSLFKEIGHMKRLEILNCGFNNLRDIGIEIRQLKSLTDLDLSNNKILMLPPDVFLLPNLESLNASHNQISKVPTFNIKVQNKHWVSEIDLSQNAITKFPGHLLFMSKKLDLGSNRIKVLNWNVMKKLDCESEQELLVDDNPLTFPPIEVCECGLRSMMNFFLEVRAVAQVYQGVKILVLGSHRSGKTSMVHSLVDQHSRLADEMQQSSSGIDSYDMSFDYETEGDTGPGKSLELCIWDFCGHPFYLYPHYLFVDQPAIALLTFNMAEYSDERFEEMIGAWFDWMIAKTNKLVVVLVGTQGDRLKNERIRKISADVKTRLGKHLQHHRQLIEQRIKCIEEKTSISPTLSEQLKAYMALLKAKFTIQSEVIVTSAKNFTGFEQLRGAIETLANDEQLFPNVMRVIKTFWLDVETYVEEKGNSLVFPVMEWESYAEEITEKFGMKHLIKEITEYLHDTGKVMWYSKHPVLKKYVFLRPSWLFDIMRQVFRHDMDEKLDYQIDDSFKALGMNISRFERLKKELLTDGVIDREFLKCLFGQLIPLEEDEAFQKTLHLFVDGFAIGYPATKRPRDTHYNLNVEADPNAIIHKILMPWYRKIDEPESLKEKWESLAERNRLVALYKFPKYMPPGLFENLSVRAHNAKHSLKYLGHWGGGVHARHSKEDVHLMIMYSKCKEGVCTFLRFELRDDSKNDNSGQVPASTMWSILLPLLMDFEELLQGFTGVLVERLMECPKCREAAFLGEWLTPKEIQSQATRPCELCEEDVDTAFLVQPREKKRVDINRIRSRISSASSAKFDPQVDVGRVLVT